MKFGFIHKKCGDFEYLTSPLLEECGCKHCFTTRLGGVSKEDYLSSMNLGFLRGDKEEYVHENVSIVCSALSFTEENLSRTNQVHENKVAVLSEPVKVSLGCDALATDKPGIPLLSTSADCVPVILYDREKNVCASIHSGWKGTVKKITAEAVKTLVSEFGSNPADIIAAIGPSIGKCCFQVKKDVYDAFSETFSDVSFIKEEGDGIHYRADLWEAVRRTLLEAGLDDENISLAGECTVCNNHLYFSSRAGKGKFGSLAAIVELQKRK
ncbi:MAG: peptidoglycan editing factor PgeF [Clostridia bacterium]|nr:peptidoglycan editing factor PgeF [Clostridia bacterium]